MKYRQMKVADESLLATEVKLKIHNKWVDGALLDKEGTILPLPHKVKEGETYIIEAED